MIFRTLIFPFRSTSRESRSPSDRCQRGIVGITEVGEGRVKCFGIRVVEGSAQSSPQQPLRPSQRVIFAGQAQCSLSNNFTTAVMLRSPRFSSIAFWNTFRTALTVSVELGKLVPRF